MLNNLIRFLHEEGGRDETIQTDMIGHFAFTRRILFLTRGRAGLAFTKSGPGLVLSTSFHRLRGLQLERMCMPRNKKQNMRYAKVREACLFEPQVKDRVKAFRVRVETVEVKFI